MRFHILGLPHTVTSKEFNACAYTQKVVKFGKMMTERGHEVIHYGHEDSDLICTEHVTVLRNEDFKKAYGDYDWRKNFFKYNTEDHAYQEFYKNAIYEIHKRKQKNDFLLPFWGSGVRTICDAHKDMIVVEPGIGYAGGHWARWKVFESYAIYHAYCGLQKVGYCNQDWYDIVIPNYFDLEDFEYCEEKEDYFLFLGRVFSGKGIDIAVQVTQEIGAKLIVAGQNPDDMTFPSHVEYIGYADSEKRKKLMAKAKGLFIASMYVEPFGGVQIESLLSGTPTITTDWGAFVENNIHGVTGFRCRTFEDFVKAAKNIDSISPKSCRKYGENFSLENVAPKYEKYFKDILNVYNGKGWYELPYDIEKTLPWHLTPAIGQRKFLIEFDSNKNEKLMSKFKVDETWQIYAGKVENIAESIHTLDLSISDFILAKFTLTEETLPYFENMIKSEVYRYFNVIFIENLSANLDKVNEIRDLLLTQKIYIIDNNTIS